MIKFLVHRREILDYRLVFAKKIRNLFYLNWLTKEEHDESVACLHTSAQLEI